MVTFRFEFEEDPTGFEVVPLHDVHFGSVFCQERLLRKIRDYVKENEKVYFYLGGDMAEFIPPKERRFEASTLPEKFKDNLDKLLTYSVEYVADFFEPIKDKCLFVLSGNHEAKYYKDLSFDFVGLLAKLLGVGNWTHSYEALVKFLFRHNKRTYSFDLYVHHGFGGGRKKGSLINNLEDLAKNYAADVYVCGHAHRLAFSTDPHYEMNNAGTVLLEKERLFVRVGGFRKSRAEVPSYEEKLGYPPNAVGTVSFYVAGITGSSKGKVLKLRPKLIS